MNSTKMIIALVPMYPKDNFVQAGRSACYQGVATLKILGGGSKYSSCCSLFGGLKVAKIYIYIYKYTAVLILSIVLYIKTSSDLIRTALELR